MRTPVHFIPILTTLVAIPFAITLFRHWRATRGLHVLWWAVGVALYGVGTFTESAVTLLGWSPPLFRAWYISGALLGGAPLAQGTVYLLHSRRFANLTAALLVTAVLVASSFVLLTPIDMSLVEPHRLSGRVMEWQWVRLFSPFINTYAFIFLVGGALVSAWRYRSQRDSAHRVIGNTLIAAGAILPGIGGTATRMGHTEVLYVAELVGLLLIWWGYRWNVRGPVQVGS
ncbi:MAG: hypothetical protein R3E10_09615 [Gemmatimonadota bacterium]